MRAILFRRGIICCRLLPRCWTLPISRRGGWRSNARRFPSTALVHNGAALLQPLVEKNGLAYLPLHDDLRVARVKRRAAQNSVLQSMAYLHNAIKFTPKGGTISVSAQRTQSGVRIAIEDTGIGMEPERYRRCRAPVSSPAFGVGWPASGRGPRPSLCQGHCGPHHGSLTIYSLPGEGTRVEILLPLAPHALSDAA